MIDLPIFCSSCGAIFPSGILAENLTKAALDDISGRCPYCGGTGQVPAGTYNFIGRSIEILNVPDKTVDDLNQLSIILRNFNNKETGIPEIRQQMQQKVRQYAAIADLLPNDQNAFQYIQMILFIITIIITLMLNELYSPLTDEKIIAQLYKSLTPPQTAVKLSDKNPKDTKVKSLGRNDLCSCGSGKKYKKCCGKDV